MSGTTHPHLGLSPKERLFGNIAAARKMLSETTLENFYKNKTQIDRTLEAAASWHSCVIDRDDIAGLGAE